MILTVLQRLSHEVGWGYKDVVDRLEEKRKIKAQAYFERKVGLFTTLMRQSRIKTHTWVSSQLAAARLRQKAVADTGASFENLTQLGY